MLVVQVRAGEGGGSRWSWEWRPRGERSEPKFRGSVVQGVGTMLYGGRGTGKGVGREWR